MTLMACSSGENKPEIWVIDNINEIAGFQVEIIGNPVVDTVNNVAAVSFDGQDDGLIIPVNPLKGYSKFTIEILFHPAADGPEEQRFVHFQDENENRGLIETRMDGEGNWSLDTFLYNKSDNNGLTLLDRDIDHSVDVWYWVALVYDGKVMSHYVNGMKELEGQIDFPKMSAGRISLGMRMNQVHWFKGLIREIRFQLVALDTMDLKKTFK